MLRVKNAVPRICKLGIGALLLVGLLTLGSTPGYSQERAKPETIQGVAIGTGLQTGGITTVGLIIYEFSTEADKDIILVPAFQRGQNQGLVNALSKMKAVGHVSITGTLGYDVSYIRMYPTPTGRKIVFVTNRKINFAEAWSDSQSQAFNLSGGIIEMNDQDKKKSTGVLYPAAQLILDAQGQLQLDLRAEAWKLSDIIDYKGTPGVN